MDSTDTALEGQTFAIDRDPRLRYIIPAVVAVAFLMEQLDATILVTAVPDIARSLATTPVRMNLAVTTYILTLAMFIPVSGWFADRFGARRIFALSLFTFTLGSILCGLATSLPMLIVTRALQGFGGAMMTPVGRLILIRSFPRSQLVTAMTYMTLPAIIGPVIGPVLGGFLTTYLSWRWIFWVNLPFGIIGMVMALRYVRDTERDTSIKFDFPGFIMVGVGCVLLQYGIENIGRPTIPVWAIIVVLAAAGLLLLGFIRYAKTAESPAVDLTLFKLRTFRVGTLAGGICRVGLNGTPFLLPLMLQVGFGLSPVVSGTLTFVSALSALAIRPISSMMLRRFGFDRVLIWSAIFGAAIVAGFALIGPETPHWFIITYVFVFGLARAAQFMTSNTLSYSETPAAQLSRATSLGGVLQQLSVSFGVSIAAMLLGLVTLDGSPLTPEKFHLTFLLMAVIPLFGLPGFFMLRPEDGRQVSGHYRQSKEAA
ncbi:DHA2 family efflux MFS transporter permease subunit [Rhizobium leucaenae]|uniref:EmrB/QacA subfamily drug resistance transporter n=1 Tax=Rhizobium leucaenae TaxID=29450 RepID=A0A7W6ZQ32_9HYPH|nr:DHA2 family efflux MFS transporter permease subunit [Rhizobium leucaenae]MBB4566636.1 EmrB/QacA subfamily drug resistance transporter [Rhizobium leucaenae]MBB6301468.1 EmrB/QacA subfamily drug resistance transporter [Rhizobium leucaenae]